MKILILVKAKKVPYAWTQNKIKKTQKSFLLIWYFSDKRVSINDNSYYLENGFMEDDIGKNFNLNF